MIIDRAPSHERVYTNGKWTEKTAKARYYVGPLQFLQEAFLPEGYPHSVASDYTNYQIFDTLQAFCSKITGLFATRAVFQRVGVGSAESTATAATLLWILQDCTAMVGRILFAWKTSFFLDADVKQWRFYADILNDSATFIDVLAPSLPKSVFVWAACISTLAKSLCGVAAGSTKAALSQHFAIRDNVADLNAKDGSQETIVELVGMIIGSFLVSRVPQDDHLLIWLCFVVFTALHLFFNFNAVRSVTIKTVNLQRAEILVENFLIKEGQDSVERVLTPGQVAQRERIFFAGQLFQSKKITIGVPLEEVLNELGHDASTMTPHLADSSYVLAYSKKRSAIIVALRDGAAAPDILRAFFHAYVIRCKLKMSKLDTVFPQSDALVNEQFPRFLEALKKNGWRVDDEKSRIHSGEWRWFLKSE